jgi:hypothetical protein
MKIVTGRSVTDFGDAPCSTCNRFVMDDPTGLRPPAQGWMRGAQEPPSNPWSKRFVLRVEISVTFPCHYVTTLGFASQQYEENDPDHPGGAVANRDD